MTDLLVFLLPAITACVVLTGIHCYLGIHVLMREVIFVDLALAQIAALGTAVAVLAGAPSDSGAAYLASLGATLLGAAFFAVTRFRDGRVPQEAVIGIAYAVASAAAILILSQSAVERDEIEHMLVGRLLLVLWPDVAKAAAIYAGVALVHIIFFKRFIALSRRHDAPAGAGARLWDFVFYATFGVVVTSSVHLAGVLLVFSFLIVPAACAMLFARDLRVRLVSGWAVGLAGSVAGLVAAAWFDLPAGPAIVAAFGVIFGVALAAAFILGARRPSIAPGAHPPGS